MLPRRFCVCVCPPPAQGQECRESDEALAKREFRAGGPGVAASGAGGADRAGRCRGARGCGAAARAALPPRRALSGARAVPAAARGEAGAGGPVLVPIPPPAARSFLEHLCGRQRSRPGGALPAERGSRRCPARRERRRGRPTRDALRAGVSGAAGGRAHTAAAGPRRRDQEGRRKSVQSPHTARSSWHLALPEPAEGRRGRLGKWQPVGSECDLAVRNFFPFCQFF